MTLNFNLSNMISASYMYVGVLVQNYKALIIFFFTSENSKAAASIISLSVQTFDRGPIVLLNQNKNSRKFFHLQF